MVSTFMLLSCTVVVVSARQTRCCFHCYVYNTLPYLLKEFAGLVLSRSCGLPAHWVFTARPWTEYIFIMLSVACKVMSSCTLWVIRVTDRQTAV